MSPGAAPPDRWNISQEALELLQQVFAVEPFPTTEVRKQLAVRLGAHPRQVQTWFQNRRARERRMGGTCERPSGALAQISGLQPPRRFGPDSATMSSLSAPLHTSAVDMHLRRAAVSADLGETMGRSPFDPLPMLSRMQPLESWAPGGGVDMMSAAAQRQFTPLSLPMPAAPGMLPGSSLSVIVWPTPPHAVVSTTQRWLDLNDLTLEDLHNRSIGPLCLADLFGASDDEQLEALHAGLAAGEVTSVTLHRRSYEGLHAAFSHSVEAQPLLDTKGNLRAYHLVSTVVNDPLSAADPTAEASAMGDCSHGSPSEEGPDCDHSSETESTVGAIASLLRDEVPFPPNGVTPPSPAASSRSTFSAASSSRSRDKTGEHDELSAACTKRGVAGGLGGKGVGGKSVPDGWGGVRFDTGDTAARQSSLDTMETESYAGEGTVRAPSEHSSEAGSSGGAAGDSAGASVFGGSPAWQPVGGGGSPVDIDADMR